MEDTILQTPVSQIAADPEARIWKATTKAGRQGDVLLKRLSGKALEDAKAEVPTRNRKVDQCLARGSRAAHIAIGDITVWEPSKAPAEGAPLVLYVEARETWGLVHTDKKGHAHHPHVIPAGWYEVTQQCEATPSGVVQD